VGPGFESLSHYQTILQEKPGSCKRTGLFCVVDSLSGATQSLNTASLWISLAILYNSPNLYACSSTLSPLSGAVVTVSVVRGGGHAKRVNDDEDGDDQGRKSA